MLFCNSVTDTAPTPVTAAKPIQGIDDMVPREIITATAFGGGSLQLSIVEVWDTEVWQNIVSDFANATTLSGKGGLFDVQNKMADYITCTKLIHKPNGDVRGKTYHGCVITAVNEAETIDIGTMEKTPTVTIQYAYVTSP